MVRHRAGCPCKRTPYPCTHSPALREAWTSGLRQTPGNAKAFYAALTQVGAPLEGLTVADFADRGPFFHMGNKTVAVDILTEIPGVEFDAAWERRVEDVIDSAAGLKAPHLAHRSRRG